MTDKVGRKNERKGRRAGGGERRSVDKREGELEGGR